MIFQVAVGCPHNTCRFCAMYKGVTYRVRPQEEVLAEFEQAARRYPEERRVFLADGDVMALSFERLRVMLAALNRLFPHLARVNLYANGSSILAKSAAELESLKQLKLNTLYVGLESGDEELLKKVAKGETAAGMCEAVQRAQKELKLAWNSIKVLAKYKADELWAPEEFDVNRWLIAGQIM